jgi:hypothetical protein
LSPLPREGRAREGRDREGRTPLREGSLATPALAPWESSAVSARDVEVRILAAE